MDKFIDPKATVTPFTAGIVVMILSAICWSAFAFPPVPVALILSAAFGLLSIKQRICSFFYKTIYLVINTLIVFSSAYGDTLIVKNMNNKRELISYYDSKGSIIPAAHRREYFVDWFNL